MEQKEDLHLLILKELIKYTKNSMKTKRLFLHYADLTDFSSLFNLIKKLNLTKFII